MITRVLFHSRTKPSTAKKIIHTNKEGKRGIAKVVIKIYAKQNEMGKEKKIAPQAQLQEAIATKTLHPETSMNLLTTYAVQPVKQKKKPPPPTIPFSRSVPSGPNVSIAFGERGGGGDGHTGLWLVS